MLTKARAVEVMNKARSESGGGHWISAVDKYLTRYEIAHVEAVNDRLGDNASWYDAYMSIAGCPDPDPPPGFDNGAK